MYFFPVKSALDCNKYPAIYSVEPLMPLSITKSDAQVASKTGAVKGSPCEKLFIIVQCISKAIRSIVRGNLTNIPFTALPTTTTSCSQNISRGISIENEKLYHHGMIKIASSFSFSKLPKHLKINLVDGINQLFFVLQYRHCIVIQQCQV